jgi:hypothetical protein
VSELSLSELRFKLQRAKACELLVERDGARLKVPLKLRALIWKSASVCTIDKLSILRCVGCDPESPFIGGGSQTI